MRLLRRALFLCGTSKGFGQFSEQRVFMGASEGIVTFLDRLKMILMLLIDGMVCHGLGITRICRKV